MDRQLKDVRLPVGAQNDSSRDFVFIHDVDTGLGRGVAVNDTPTVNIAQDGRGFPVVFDNSGYAQVNQIERGIMMNKFAVQKFLVSHRGADEDISSFDLGDMAGVFSAASAACLVAPSVLLKK